MIEDALRYARMGLAVFPLAYRSKKPHIAGGVKNATTDEAVITRGWTKFPKDNIGIACGSASGGLVVIDLDVHPERGIDGTETLWEWERAHGELPETATAITGSGGKHIYYRVSAGAPMPRNSAGGSNGVDVRGEGGYVVGAPSVHEAGGVYAWENDPEEFGIAVADANVMAFIASVRPSHAASSDGGGARQPFEMPERIGKGARNETFFRRCCQLIETDRITNPDYLFTLLQAENTARCEEPLPASEIRAIVDNAASRYKPSERSEMRERIAKPEIALMLQSNGKPQQTIENAARVLQGDPALAGRFVYNEVAYTRMVELPLPWDDGTGERAVTDADYCALAAYLERMYGLFAKSKAIDAVVTVSMMHKVNPITTWLDSLKWDGVPRVDTLLAVYLGCEVNDYNAAVMRVFMAGAVARAYEPGTKFDYMPVLHGRQGLGKSMFLRRLGHCGDWYCDNFNTVEGDAAAEKLRGMWIVEMAELLAAKRQKDVESIKAFITSTVDTIRPKYARETEQRPRCCVFAGTTNSAAFLTDSTGNRRFLPVECGINEPMASLFDDDAPAYFEQAWAEAVEMRRSGAWGLVFDDRLQAYALDAQAKFTEEDIRIGLIQQYLDGCGLSDRVCVVELIERALGITDPDKPRKLINEVHEIMRSEIRGWVPIGKARTDYGVQRCYMREDAVM